MYNNYAYGTTSAQAATRGINYDMSYQSTILCNHPYNVTNGIQFNTPCTNSRVTGNSMSNSSNGLRLSGSAVIGAQGSSGHPSWNKWFGGITKWTNGLAPGLTNIWYDPSGGTYYDASTLNFGNLLPQVTTASTSDPCPNTGPHINDPDSVPGMFDRMLAYRVIGDSVGFNAYTSRSNWIAKRLLLAQMIADTNGWYSDTLLSAFLDSMIDLPLGQLAHVEWLFGQDSLAEAIALNDSIVPAADSLALWERAVNAIWFSTGIDTLPLGSDDDYTLLQTLASLCPVQGGLAVYRARAVLQQFAFQVGDTTIPWWIDDSICSYPAPRLAAATPQKSAAGNAITADWHPNPSNDMVRLDYSLHSDCDGILEIRTLTGQIIWTKTLSAKDHYYNLSVGNWLGGMYLCNITTCDGRQHLINKLVIVH